MSKRGARRQLTLPLPEAVAKAIDLLKAGDADEARGLCAAILKAAPDHVQTLCMHAVASAELGRQKEAVVSYRKALKLQPDIPVAHSNLGVALRELGRHQEAVASLRKALELDPDSASAHNNLGTALRELGQKDEAAASYRRAVQLDPGMVEAHLNLGNFHLGMDRYEDALGCYQRALQVHPQHAGAHQSAALALHGLGRYEEAVASYRRALSLAPDHSETHYNLGVTLGELRRYTEAAESYRSALALRPNYAAALNNLGLALRMLHRLAESAQCYRRATEISPNDRNAQFNLANILREQGLHEQAIDRYERVLGLSPDNAGAFMLRAAEKRAICDWGDFDQLADSVDAWVESGKNPILPFGFLAFSDDPAKQRVCASRYAEQLVGGITPLPRRSPRDSEAPVRVAYLSADFHQHATAYLMAELFERHDRERFETHAISFGPATGDVMQKRLQAAFDGFHDVREQSDREVAGLIRELGVDIAVDLKGYTQDCRPRILAYRPAPVQINYLGYPGTMGADFIDYVLVDRFVAPPDRQPYFTERLFYLPDCYQVNDSTRAIAAELPSREACGLPADGFVFCCFNHNYKFTPSVFERWMSLLRRVPDSLMWLFKDNDSAERNLRREAERRDVDPRRLVFAPKLPLAEHLARHRHADLFLDTFPYSAHTTASDALWAGVPVLTRVGQGFASRVAGSLLQTIGLPELITDDIEAYEALAYALATDPGRLGALRERLARNRETSPLFDGALFARNLEAAYLRMLEQTPGN
jgi:predicted O-linked N-acetylglucosamine transferase (SPINDLY family)